MKFEEKTTHRETIYQGKIIDLFLDDVQLPDGKAAKRELVKHPGAVAIIAFVEADKMIFVRQYRKALEKTIVEIPAGKIDPTDTDHLETAKRELEEETAYQAKAFYYDTSFYTSPGFADELLHVYVAEGLHQVAQPLAQDEDEFIELLEWDFNEAWAAYQNGEIIDAKTVYALMFWKLKREKVGE
ncbi:NUDIX hydrolase [Isobaculum melis]|uniref:ADP-ribose pyrophosphatase n=1 Tax=Isobaculum melis TaxID=142588 RepID=A0A1H9RHD4_9LACT|nr:NUDIX hydrolase [Isobaculum melis]SER72122.1 ADP-ribose pyrophosphatase [Isobaculum melis]